jgi:type I restriction enzyme S subunit
LYSYDIKRQIYVLVVGSNYPAVNSSDVANLKFSIPKSTSERQAIADLLSTWDEAIEKTERLILAKEMCFKWLLRELISEPRNTQKNTEWKKVKLGEVCKVITSNVDKITSPDEAPVHLCNYMDVYKNYYITKELDFMPASATAGEIEKYQLRVHDVLLTKDSETPDDIANSACILDAPENLLCGYHLAILRPRENLFGPYLNFALHTPRIRYEFSRQANGATRFGLTMSAYNMVGLPVPPLEKQKEIAETLSAAQHEVDLLKKLVEKYKTQKRGLMQKMLTGEWCVKPEIVNQYMEA